MKSCNYLPDMNKYTWGSLPGKSLYHIWNISELCHVLETSLHTQAMIVNR